MRAGRDQRTAVRSFAARVATLHPKNKAHTSLVGLMAGALHALDRATDFHFDDARGKPVPREFAHEFRKALEAIAKGRARPDAWLSGFYLHSAMLRLQPINEKLDDLLSESETRVTSVGEAVNSIKHNQAAHISGKNTVPFAAVLRSAEIACERLERLMRQGKATQKK